MQLTEIIQLVLLSFVALIVMLFFVSYVSYKAKNKNKNNLINNLNENIEVIENNPVIQNDEKNPVHSLTNGNSRPKFQVFTPEHSVKIDEKTSSSKKHFPRTLSIKL